MRPNTEVGPPYTTGTTATSKALVMHLEDLYQV